MNYYKWFAYSLFTGKVISQFNRLVNFYVLSPTHFIKDSSSRRVLSVIQILMSNKINSKASLLEKWKQDPSFMKYDIESWVLPRYNSVLKECWDDLIHDVPYSE